MSLKRLAAIIIVSAFIMTALTFIAIPMAAGQGNRPFTKGQLDLIAEKEKNLRANGVDPNTRIDPGFHTPTFETKFHTEEIRMTKQELLNQLDQKITKDQQYISELEKSEIGRAKAQQVRDENERARQEIEKLPPEGRVMTITGVEQGSHSANVSNYTWNQTTLPNHSVDPVNLLWFNIGSAWDVQYDMNNWTVQSDWITTTCGGSQFVWVFDAQHAGGWDGWRQDNYQLEANWGWPHQCGIYRDHIRIFQSLVRDSHSPGYNWWSVGDAHHDNTLHQSVGSWIDARGITVDSFKNWDDSPLWYVGGFWDSYFGNDGYPQGVWNDGILTNIQLNA